MSFKIGSGVKSPHRGSETGRKLLASVLAVTLFAAPLTARAQTPQTRPTTRAASAIPPELAGRMVEEVRLIGKPRPLGSDVQAAIVHQVRTREGEKFEPVTVEGDYQRIYGLKKFANVEARVEPTATGVIVIFEMTEQSQIKEIRFKGNETVETKTLQEAINLKAGEAIDSFRLSLAKDSIQHIYEGKNYPFTHVEIDQEELNKSGILTFNVVEGQKVRVRKVLILGNKTFSDSRVKDEIKTKSWFPFFVPGTYDPEQLEQDIASIRLFYEHHGFFDVRVGRKTVVSPDQSELMIEFLVEEGQRYTVERVSFKTNPTVSEAELRKNLKLIEGRVFDNDLLDRDKREIVKAYSPFGFIYVANELNPDPDYFSITPRQYFKKETGKVELVYDIHEGKQFRLGRVIVKGNGKTQDKVVLREMRVTPGQLYNSDEVQRAQDRIRATGLFMAATITPIKTNPESDEMRDLLVEVSEGQTAKLNFGAGITSNSGVLGEISYEQKNFDITNVPSSTSELFSKGAFVGAGQTFRASLEPGTQLSRARIDFIEPYIFDQPYSLGVSAYLSQRLREDWTESRIGGRVSLGKRFDDIWSGRVALRGEDVRIDSINNEELRAPEVLALEGHSTVTSATLEVKRNTTNSPILPSRGTVTTVGWEHVGALGGDFDFDKITAGWDYYTTVYEDLLDRKTIVMLRADAGYITGESPFFEKFYGGGIGSVRGFRYRGISPRSGIANDPIGGDFSLTGTAELSFPLAGDVLRGVLFTDAGTVEKDFQINTIRSSVGFGFRLILPFFGQIPIAVDFGFPITKDNQDDRRIFSFSLSF
jgi:outer membrane protein insertion porin family